MEPRRVSEEINQIEPKGFEGFMGFSTAGSGKQVNVPAEALAKTMHLFDDLEIPEAPQETVGFSTGAMKPVQISEEAMNKAKALFAEESPPKPKQTPEKNPSSEATTLPREKLKSFFRPFKPVTSLGTYKFARPELSRNSCSRPQFAQSLKRKTTSDQSVPKKVLEKSVLSGLQQLNNNRPVRKIFNSKGLTVTADNALNFVFRCECFETKECFCSQTKCVTWEECYDRMKEVGFNTSKEWVRIHYRQVVWKYASYERRIYRCKGVLCLKNLFDELCRRFNKEHNEAKRSIIKKILEGDELASRKMVLCVGTVTKEPDKVDVELTDGWYSLYSSFFREDQVFNLLESGKFKQGLKVMVFGGRLVDSKFQIQYNSMRRAPWHARLGCCKNQTPFLVNINSIKLKGGLVPKVSGFVAKRYPLVYIESKENRDVYTSTVPENPQNLRCYFEFKIKDALIEYSPKGTGSCYVCVRFGAEELHEECAPGKLVNLSYLTPFHRENRLYLNFGFKSKFKPGKKKRPDLVSKDKLFKQTTRVQKEGDLIGTLQRTKHTVSGELKSLVVTGHEYHTYKVKLHEPSFFKHSLSRLPSIIGFSNLRIAKVKPNIIVCKTCYNTQVFKNKFPLHMQPYAQDLQSFSEVWMETVNN